MAYVGQTRSRVLIAQLAHLGIGECVVRGELPARRPKFSTTAAPIVIGAPGARSTRCGGSALSDAGA
jgi:hypothetical protein